MPRRPANISWWLIFHGTEMIVRFIEAMKLSDDSVSWLH